jgi:membrane fusion protein, multidrug efflux system
MAAMRRALRRILQLAVLGLLGWAAYWYFAPFQPAQQQQAKQAQQKGPGFRRGGGNPNDTVPVLASPARLADVPVYLDGVGTAKALNTVLVRPQVDGKLMRIMFTEGHEVTQGSVIAKIDPTTFQAAYDIAVAKKEQDEALLANAQLDLERYTKLAATNAVQKQQVDTQRSLVNQYTAQTHSDQAAIDNAKAILDYTDVVAPITGLTGIRQVDEGNIVHASDTTGLVTITQIKPIALLFNLPQQNLPDLNKGMAEGALPVQAMAGDGTSVVDTGKVVVINNQVDQTTGTVQIKAEFPNSNVQLWPGQFINVRVLINTLRQVVVVPTAAVQRGPDGAFVYVIKEDATVAMRPITVSKQDDLQAVVASGVQASDRVVTTGFGRLADGSKVVATSAEEAGQVSTDPKQPRPAGAAPKGKGQGQGQRQQGAANAPGTGPAGTTAADSGTATDPSQPNRRRDGGAPKGNEQPAQGSADAPGTGPPTAAGGAATDPPQPPRRRDGGAPKGNEQPAQGSAPAPSAAP